MAVLDNPPPPSTAATKINPDTVHRAVNALLKWRNSKPKTQNPQLFNQDNDDDDDFIYLVLTLKKIPQKNPTNPHKIPLPYPLLHLPSADLCLIIDDRPNKTSKLTSDKTKAKIKSDEIPVSKVLKFSKLKSNFKPFESKRKLCDSYDMFLSDKRLIPLLPKVLGKQFFKKKKVPVPLDLTKENWKEQIERACSSAFLNLSSGTCSVVRVGKGLMERGEIAENVMAAVNGVVEVVPKKWGGVRSFHLKFSESLALPIYQSLPDLKLKIEGTMKEEERTEGEKLLGKIKKKGRIHEVRYMDGEVGEDIVSDNDDVGGSEFGGKKRKKRDSMNREVGSELIGEKILKKSVDQEGEGEDCGEKKVKKKKQKENQSVL